MKFVSLRLAQTKHKREETFVLLVVRPPLKQRHQWSNGWPAKCIWSTYPLKIYLNSSTICIHIFTMYTPNKLYYNALPNTQGFSLNKTINYNIHLLFSYRLGTPGPRLNRTWRTSHNTNISSGLPPTSWLLCRLLLEGSFH